MNMKSTVGEEYVKRFMEDVRENYPSDINIDPTELFEQLEADRKSGELKAHVKRQGNSSTS